MHAFTLLLKRMDAAVQKPDKVFHASCHQQELIPFASNSHLYGMQAWFCPCCTCIAVAIDHGNFGP